MKDPRHTYTFWRVVIQHENPNPEFEEAKTIPFRTCVTSSNNRAAMKRHIVHSRHDFVIHSTINIGGNKVYVNQPFDEAAFVVTHSQHNIVQGILSERVYIFHVLYLF